MHCSRLVDAVVHAASALCVCHDGQHEDDMQLEILFWQLVFAQNDATNFFLGQLLGRVLCD